MMEQQLATIDSCRFRALAEESAERLDMLGLLTKGSSRVKEQQDNPQAQQARNKKDMYSLMVHQKELEEKYEALQQRRSQLRGLQNKSKYLQNMKELKEITTALKDSAVTINQNLKDQPTIVGNLAKIQKDRADLQGILDSTVEELKEDKYNGLVEQVKKRMEQQRLLWETQMTHEKTRESLKVLEEELKAEREGFAKAVEQKNAAVQQLTLELKRLKSVTALTVKYEKDTALAQRETLHRIQKARLDALRGKINNLQESTDRDELVNERSIAFLGGQKEQLEALHKEWEGKYERDYTDKNAEFDELTEKRGTAKDRLDKFQARWELDKAEKKALAEEAKQRAIEEENKLKLLKVMNLAQSKIRFVWRVYFKKKGPGKKKKKGKGKKSKKKK